MKRSMLTTVAWLAIIASTGCLGEIMSGGVAERISEFDGTVELSMRPAWVGLKTPLKAALFKSSKMADDKMVLRMGAVGAHNIARGKSLALNIDGETVSFQSIDLMTDIKLLPSVGQAVGQNFSSKRYMVPMSLLDRILESKRVVVRLDLTKSYFEGVFGPDWTMAIPVFKKFRMKSKELFPAGKQ